MALVNYSTKDGVAVLELNNPPANSYTHDMLREFDDAILKARFDESVHVLVVRGAGEKFFCAGAHIDLLAKATLEYKRNFVLHGHETLVRLENTPKLVIAAVNGHATGGGLEIALSCDIRLCSENAHFGASEVRWSHMAGGQAYILPRTVPLGWAFWFCLTGQFIDADTAFRIGIVQGVYPQNQLMEQATLLANTIKANGPIVVQQTKQFIYNSLDMPLSTAKKMERMYYQKIRQSPDYDEGSAAFVEKRRPDFSAKPTGANPKG